MHTRTNLTALLTKFLIVFLLLLINHTTLQGQLGSTPFNKGINLTTWFQASTVGGVAFRKYTKQDFIEIQSLGVDVIRLPINLAGMSSGAPNYTLSSDFFCMLDEAVDWAEELGIHLILDNHTYPDFTNTTAIEDMLKKMWLQMATHYVGRSNLIYYEIQNEPHDITDADWNAIQQVVIDEIRTVDNVHTLIIGGAGYNGLWNLDMMPVYSDNNLIYTFHFYEPFLFTHQGATWVNPSLDLVSNIPFPYNTATMPPLDPIYIGTWIEYAYNGYPADGTLADVHALIDIVDNFQQTRNVPVYCGEYGVYIPNSDNNERVYWYGEVRNYLEQKNLAWTTWDYRDGFGLFNANSAELFDHDLNVSLLNALGFNVPPQTPFMIQTETTASCIYDDYMGVQIENSSYGAGTRDFNSTTQTESGKFCIQWDNEQLYGTMGFDFVPDRDFSQLVTDGFALQFDVRSSDPTAHFQIRFEDTDTGTSDHPWRMSANIDNTLATWDGQWQRISIPLSSFNETGAWEGSYYNPQGLFDWAAIDHFRIVAEFQNISSISFDNIKLAANIEVAPKVFLQGAYNGTDMNADLSGNNLLPITQPYNPTYTGTESVIAIPNADIVDWVLVELRYPSTEIQATRAAFLKKDGSVVDLDGISPVRFEGVQRLDYHVAVQHRNHLSVMTDAPVVFQAVN